MKWHLEVENSPKGANEVKDLLAYEMTNGKASCQEQLNKALAVVASEVDKEDKTYFLNYATMWELANFGVQLKPVKPSITIGQNHVKTDALAVYALQSHAHISYDFMLHIAPHIDQHGFKFLPANLPYGKSIRDGCQNYAQLLKEKNQYLSKYEDFHIGGISEDIIDTKFDNVTLQEKLELAGVAGDINPTVFTKSKGIWQVKTTKEQVVEAMHHVTETLESIQEKLSDGHKNHFIASPYPQVLNTFTVPT
eukprot:3834183-Ditylum_brightwellii.AAC.1